MKTCLLLLFILSSPLIHAAKKGYVAPESAPAELKYLLDTIHHNDLTESQAKQFKESILKFDWAITLLSEKEWKFLVKSEIYKSILRTNSDERSFMLSVNNKILDRLESITKDDSFGERSLFAQWLIRAIHTDLIQILNNEQF